MTAIAPFLWLALAAFIIAIPGAMLIFSNDDTPPARTRFRPVRRGIGLLLLLLAIVTALLAMATYRYLYLFNDRPIALVELHQEAPQQFRATIMMTSASGRESSIRRQVLNGDAWAIDAQVLRWQLPAILAGLPPLYSLERISGSYDDLERERDALRSMHTLRDSPIPDLFTLKQDFPDWLPFVDARYGSAARMPMFDKARYMVLFDDHGDLLAEPADTHSANRLEELGMDSAYQPAGPVPSERFRD